MADPTPAVMRRILVLLRRAYGPRAPQCWGDGVSVLVDTILSQNTSAANSDAGYRQLRRRFRSWKQVAEAPVEEVERCIRVSGLSNLKAPRIQAILRRIKSERGKLDLQFLNDLDDEAAYAYLRAFPGVGPKTACCTLLFAFGKALFPVDTHIHRIARRLGLVSARATAEQTRDALTPMIDHRDRYETHVLLIEHGRKTCRAINPRCDDCVLLRYCGFGSQRVRQGSSDAEGGGTCTAGRGRCGSVCPTAEPVRHRRARKGHAHAMDVRRLEQRR